jgi:hypothetical protein
MLPLIKKFSEEEQGHKCRSRLRIANSLSIHQFDKITSVRNKKKSRRYRDVMGGEAAQIPHILISRIHVKIAKG